jgi:hypothetical protein
MDKEQIDLPSQRHLNGCGRGIHGGADPGHLARILYLEPIECVRIIIDFGNPEELVGVSGDFGEPGHPPILQLPGGIEAENAGRG